MTEQPIYSVEGESSGMNTATDTARATFKFFWRELSWERRRIAKSLDMAAVKVSFPVDQAEVQGPSTENMWISDIEFDGQTVSGVLLNEPQWIKSVSAGDVVSVPLTAINDWLYVIEKNVFGGYTIHVMRSTMSAAERSEHDSAWGLDFEAPGNVQILPPRTDKKPGLLSGLFSSKRAALAPVDPEWQEHPMSENMAEQIDEALKQNPSVVTTPDEGGWLLLHREALAGNYIPVVALLEHGADPQAQNNNGQTAVELARQMGWPRIVELFENRPSGIHGPDTAP